MKVTRRQIREIIREHEAERQAEYLLNEGFFDWLKKLGKEMIAAYKKQQALTDDYKGQIEDLIKGEDDPFKETVKLLSDRHKDTAVKAKKELFKKITSDVNETLAEEADEELRNKLSLAALAYVWSAAGSDGG